MLEKVLHVSCPIVSKYWEKHDDIKTTLLSLIKDTPSLNTTEFKHIDNNNDNVVTDWYLRSHLQEPDYVRFFKESVKAHIKTVLKDHYYVDTFDFESVWFQQYHEHQTHDWHRHGACSFANVYYLELPLDGPKTEIKSLNDNSIIIPEVYEGCILTFPGFFEHQSPPSSSHKRKTIIAFNINVTKD